MKYLKSHGIEEKMEKTHLLGGRHSVNDYLIPFLCGFSIFNRMNMLFSLENLLKVKNKASMTLLNLLKPSSAYYLAMISSLKHLHGPLFPFLWLWSLDSLF